VAGLHGTVSMLLSLGRVAGRRSSSLDEAAPTSGTEMSWAGHDSVLEVARFGALTLTVQGPG
jgi:hypothetical protein